MFWKLFVMNFIFTLITGMFLITSMFFDYGICKNFKKFLQIP